MEGQIQELKIKDITDFIATFPNMEEAKERIAIMIDGCPLYEPETSEPEPNELPKIATLDDCVENTFHQTDMGNAERLVARYGKDIRYCHPFGRWLIWNGIQWKEDDSGELKRRTKNTIRNLYVEAANLDDKKERKAIANYAMRCESDQKLKSMISLAQSEPGIPVLPHQFNTDKYLFNCLNGTINLRTGQLQSHKRDDLITKLSPYKARPRGSMPGMVETPEACYWWKSQSYFISSKIFRLFDDWRHWRTQIVCCIRIWGKWEICYTGHSG